MANELNAPPHIMVRARGIAANGSCTSVGEITAALIREGLISSPHGLFSLSDVLELQRLMRWGDQRQPFAPIHEVRFKIEYLTRPDDERSVCYTKYGFWETIEDAGKAARDAAIDAQRHFGARGFQIRDLNENRHVITFERFSR